MLLVSHIPLFVVGSRLVVVVVVVLVVVVVIGVRIPVKFLLRATVHF